MKVSLQLIKYKNIFAIAFFLLSLFVFNKPTFAATCTYDPASGEPPPLIEIVCPVVRGLNIAILISGVIFSMFILITAYKLYTSVGDPKAAAGAKATLTYAVLGFIIVIGAWTIFMLIVNILGVEVPLSPFTAIQEALINLVCNSASAPIVNIGC